MLDDIFASHRSQSIKSIDIYIEIIPTQKHGLVDKSIRNGIHFYGLLIRYIADRYFVSRRVTHIVEHLLLFGLNS